MTKCYYICMESVNINGHIAVSFLIFKERKTEWRAREVKHCVKQSTVQSEAALYITRHAKHGYV